jgi:hypothetical protein
VFDAIKHLSDFAVLQAFSEIAVRYHLVTPATVGALWTTFLTLSYIPGCDMEEFLTLIETTARRLGCDGLSLAVKRAGPTFRDQLQRIVDAIRASDAMTFAIDIAKGNDLLADAVVSESILQTYRQRLIIASKSIYGDGQRVGETVMAVYAMTCVVCGGRGHVKEQCPSARIVTPPGDTGTSPPDYTKDRTHEKRNNPNDASANGGRNNDKPGGRNNREKREWTGKWEDWMSLCRFCVGLSIPESQKKHLHKD